MIPERRRLVHEVPSWVAGGSTMYITIYCQDRGRNQLAQPEIADAIFEAARAQVREGTWWMRMLLLMPDHLHMLVSFAPCERMSTVLERWKALIARRHGIEWQAGFTDRRVLDEQALQERQAYILNSPVRAGLVKTSDDWKYVYRGPQAQ